MAREEICYLCMKPFKTKKGLKIHQSRSVKHYKEKLDAEDPNRITLNDFF